MTIVSDKDTFAQVLGFSHEVQFMQNIIHHILKQYWGYDTFRPLQEDIITSVLAGNDTLALLPTGGGKSICFQVPAMAQEGICLVVTPLIALMQDQVEQLKRRGISAIAIYSGMHPNQIDIALDNCIYGQVKFLYISPERLQTKLFLERAKLMKISLLAIDEAHCISQWGYDFRPPYLQIAAFRELVKPVPMIAVTATATKEVKADIIEKLEMQNTQVFQQSFARKNLSYSTLQEEDKERRLLGMLQKVQGTAIVYVRNRRKTQEIANLLQRAGIAATFYHAGLSTPERSKRQEMWIKNEVRVMVATNAFGMGIDKPDVRLVVHLDLPETLEAYYQEAGRAGRDTQKAFATVLYNQNDIASLEKNVLQNYPPIELVRRVYQCLGNYYQLAVGSGELASYDLDLVAFQHRFDLPPTDTYFALKILENQGFIALSEAIHHASKISISVDNRQLYDFQLKNPKYDSFIKLLLRMYGGELFTGYLTISEATISKAFSAPLPEIEQMLGQLERFEILQYDKQKNKPQLTFLTGRYDAKTLPLQIHEIEHRKVYDLQKAKAVRAYIEHTKRCRTQLLLEYFDEHTDKNCGICDICIRKKREETTAEHSIQVKIQTKEKIKALLANGAMSLDLLSKIMQPNHNAQFQEIIREMIEDEVLLYAPTGEISLHL